MGLAALVVGVLIALTIAVTVAYGTLVGMARAGRFLWRFLVPEEGLGTTDMEPAYADLRCWTEKQCPPSVREACPAYVQRVEELPCWLTNLRAEGSLRPACFTCHQFSIRDLVA